MTCDRKALTDKVAILGVDGFEPMLAKKFMDQGKMPNLKAFVDRGSAREDLVLLGAMPTVTPPQWTTLATGAYPVTHGITAFFNPHPEKADTYVYALDSRMCLAEPLWNVFAEAGKKTMVWHWPGSSWPPTSDNPNLHVVDGTQPGGINMGTAVIDWETITLASEDIQELLYTAHDAPNNPGVGCIITEMDDIGTEVAKGADAMKAVLGNSGAEMHSVLREISDTEIACLGQINLNMTNSPIKAATGWAAAPAGAKEFMVLTSNGFVRRPALILLNEQRIYDRVAIYRSKKETTPLIILENDLYNPDYVDEVKVGEHNVLSNRCARTFEIAPDGSKVRLWMSVAYDLSKDTLWHPKALYNEIKENVGMVPPVSMATGKEPEFAEKLLIASWDHYVDWQGHALTYLMDNKYEVIFSHLHNVDLIGHQIWHFAKHRDDWGNDELFYQGLIEYVYKQTDRYLGYFLPYLDQGWTMIITSDHGLITEENHPPGLGEMRNNGTVMVDMGYTVLKKDATGQTLGEVDLSKTKAVINRGGYITINLKGRNVGGIVEPTDQYQLEEQIISDLYRYQEPITGRRVVAMALRNKDAAIIGLGGPRCGDIIVFMEEGFNIIHMDSLSTQSGYFDTSVSPIFVAAGPGIKAGFKTNRVIRQVDVAPTMAVLGGVRMPNECEGAPAYQILSEAY